MLRVFAGVVVLAILISQSVHAQSAQTIEFWDEQRRGANFFNRVESGERLRDAALEGIEFIRLSTDKWESEERDFLIGNADRYQGLVEADLARLVEILDAAHEAGLSVVLTMLSLPGHRWVQNNDGERDGRLWEDFAYHDQAATFWRDLAVELREHPAIAAYNILNEPHPYTIAGGDASPASEAYAMWQETVEGTPADLNLFHRRVIRAIREVDPSTPIMLDGPNYASPEGAPFMTAHDDPAILYSFHTYGLWRYITFRVNRGRFSYPDRMPVGWTDRTEPWTIERLAEPLTVIDEWADQNSIEANRIIASEFGVSRRVPGAAAYLEHTVDLLERRRWHWAFYAYREDTWDEMDYELPPDAPCVGSGRASGEGPLIWCLTSPERETSGYRLKPWSDTAMFDVLRRRLND